jgi:hypothetical protein
MTSSFSPDLGLSAILKFFVPSHLYGFEFALVGSFRIACETRQFGYVAMQISEAHCERVKIRMRLRKQNPDVFGVVPGE